MAEVGNFSIPPFIQGLLAEAKRREDEDNMLVQLSNNEQAISEQPPPQQAAPQEEIDGTKMVNRAIMKSLPQAPNPYVIGTQAELIGNKKQYADAERAYLNPDATDAIKAKALEDMNTAHAVAGLLRARGDATGMDLNGYGLNVSLDDALKNFDSQKARDIMAFQQGYYAKPSDLYYEDKYQEGIMRGYSPEQAARLAGAQSRRYQANRVAYLNGLYNSYGRDGLVNNDLAAQILGQMGMEKQGAPLANFYTQMYANPKNKYDNEMDIAKNAIQDDEAIRRLMIGYAISSGLAEQQHNFKTIDTADDRAWGLKMANALRDEQSAQDIDTWNRQIEQASQLADMAGRTPEEKQAIFLAKMGITFPTAKGKDKGTDYNDKLTGDLIESIKLLDKREETLQTSLADMTLTAEQRDALEKDLKSVRADRAKYMDKLKGIHGLILEYPAYDPNNTEQNLKVIGAMFAQQQAKGAPREVVVQTVKEWIHESDPHLSDAVIEQMLNEKFPSNDSQKNSGDNNSAKKTSHSAKKTSRSDRRRDTYVYGNYSPPTYPGYWNYNR